MDYCYYYLDGGGIVFCEMVDDRSWSGYGYGNGSFTLAGLCFCWHL